MIDEISLFYWSWIYIKSFAGNIILLHRAIMTTIQNRRLWLVDWLIYLLIDWLCFVLRHVWEHFTQIVTSPDCILLGYYGLWAGRDIYRAIPDKTRDLGIRGLIRSTALFSRLTRQARVTADLLCPGFQRDEICQKGHHYIKWDITEQENSLSWFIST